METVLNIELEQSPIIKYDAIDEIANQVATRMQKLDLDNLEVTEVNFKEIKEVRANLNKEFKEYEDKRKLIKDMVMKPYNDFETKYSKISTYYKGADEKLKTKINEVEETLLKEKVDKLKEAFGEVNEWDWISFEDLDLKITRSTSDKKIIDEVNEFMTKTRSDLATIDTLENKERILAKYQMTKDLNKSISEVNIEIEREKTIVEQSAVKEQEEVTQDVKNTVEQVKGIVIDEVVQDTPEPVYQTQFKVTGTKKQLQALKQFMNEEGIVYE